MRAVVAIVTVALSFAGAGALVRTQPQALPDGCRLESFDLQGTRRAYIACVPQPLPQGPLPVVMGFHGGVGIPQNWLRTMPFHELGAQEGFVTVYMAQACRDGSADCDTTQRIGWNVGKPGTAGRIDDHAYVRAVVDRLEQAQKLSIDRSRLYGTGHSLGGIYLYSVVCDMPGFFAAIGPISAPPTDATCTPRPGTVIFHVHGTLDPNVPFDTGCCSGPQKTPGDPAYLERCDARPLCFNPVNWWPPVRSGDHPFAKVAGLDAIASQGLGCGTTLTVGDKTDTTTCYRYAGCPGATVVEACLIAQGNHVLRELNEAFPIRTHLWSRFRDRRSTTPRSR
jgi:poly(3-hydroxybutyrate) depolymerase